LYGPRELVLRICAEFTFKLIQIHPLHQPQPEEEELLHRLTPGKGRSFRQSAASDDCCIIGHLRRVFPSRSEPRLPEERVRPCPEAQIVPPAPVDSIMTGAAAWPGKVGDLVLLETGFPERCCGQFEHCRRCLFIRKIELPSLHHGCKRGPLFDRQPVSGDMIRLQRCRFLQLLLPLLQSLAGQGVNQVDADTPETCRAGHLYGISCFFCRVDPAQNLQLAVIERLDTYGKPVDAYGQISFERLKRDGPRIYLQGYLSIFFQSVTIPDSLHDSCDLPRREE